MQANASGSLSTGIDWMVVFGLILVLGFIAGSLMLLLTASRNERTSYSATQPLPLRITRREDKGHCLIFNNGRLVAALGQEIQKPGAREGRWVLEVGFEDLQLYEDLTFANLEEAQRWIEQQLRNDQ